MVPTKADPAGTLATAGSGQGYIPGRNELGLIATKPPTTQAPVFAGLSDNNPCAPPVGVLAPEIERDACRTFRTLARRLEARVDRKRYAAALQPTLHTVSRKPAFSVEAARHYHKARNGAVSIVPPRSNQPAGAPAVTVEALCWAARAQGFVALRDTVNQYRLRTLTPAQLDETRQRLRALKAAGKIPGKRA